MASIEDTTIEDTTIEDTTSSVPLASLTELDVVSLLGALGLERYADACLAVPLRGADLVHCTEGDLAAAGVFFRPHRLSLLESLSGFATEGVPSTLLVSAASPSSPSACLITGGDLPNWLAQAQAQLAAEEGGGQQPPMASEEHEGQQPPLLGLRVGSAAADVDPFPMGAASSGTMVLPKTTRDRGSASTGSADQHDAALEVHYAPDRGSIRAVNGRSLGSLGAAPYLIGRGTTGVDLTLGEPHISARQATILPPSAHAPHGSGAPSALTPDEASWRLVDTSTNGTLVNGVPVGRNGCVSLRDGVRDQQCPASLLEPCYIDRWGLMVVGLSLVSGRT